MSKGRYIDLTNQRFGRLIAMQKVGVHPSCRAALWLCNCDCGNKKIVSSQNLRRNKTFSCGCFYKERPHAKKHGMSKTSTYRIWGGMIARCTNPKRKEWKNYGGRGISICKNWFIFENFFADMGIRPPGMDLDRIDNNADYCKENCRWITRQVNVRNSRKSKIKKETAKQIKLLIRQGIPHKNIAQEFNIKKNIVTDISTRRTWINA